LPPEILCKRAHAGTEYAGKVEAGTGIAFDGEVPSVYEYECPFGDSIEEAYNIVRVKTDTAVGKGSAYTLFSAGSVDVNIPVI
jgi:hypothetical protein